MEDFILKIFMIGFIILFGLSIYILPLMRNNKGLGPEAGRKMPLMMLRIQTSESLYEEGMIWLHF